MQEMNSKEEIETTRILTRILDEIAGKDPEAAARIAARLGDWYRTKT